MNCCYHRTPFQAELPILQLHLGASLQGNTCFQQRVLFGIFGLLWLQLAPSMHQGPALLKAMQVHQMLIQIAVLVGFTPTALLVQF